MTLNEPLRYPQSQAHLSASSRIRSIAPAEAVCFSEGGKQRIPRDVIKGKVRVSEGGSR